MKTNLTLILTRSIGLAALTILAATPAFGQAVNQITTVSPNSAAQGTANLLVTFTLDTDSPPAPPAGAPVTSVTLGTIAGSSITHASQYIVTAQFSIPAAEPVGWKDAAIVFSPPEGGTLTFSKSSAFQVTGGSGLVADFAGSPTSGAPPLTVTFANTSTGTITTQLWNFGDSATSADLHPIHTYTNIGSYTVSLTVFGAGGSNTLTRTGYITVAQPPAADAYVVVDTGQTQCYGNTGEMTCPAPGQPFYGQDSQFSGYQPAYQDNGDGTITDLNTGLRWVQARGSKVSWDAALAGAATCNVGGYSDWRMPTIKELYSLIDFTGRMGGSLNDPAGYIPFINTNYFGFAFGNPAVGERVIDCQDWSATHYVSTTMGGDDTVFGVNFADGRIKGYPRYEPGSGGTTNYLLYARYVRGNPSYGLNNFVNNSDGTVTDRATGLMWSQADSGTGVNWSNALAWVQTKNSAGYCGYNDWRLPNAKELQSIVDYSRSPATSSSAAINPVFDCTAIVNEAAQTDYPFYWASTTMDQEGVYVCFGRAMGYMNGSWLDVHGAGAQRSDPKDGNPANFPNGRGPQGDAVRIFNYVRLVRTVLPTDDSVGDGIPNVWRAQYFGEPGTTTNAFSCATCDPDGDGAANYSEYIADTNPTNALSYLHIQSVTRATSLAVFFPSSANRKYTLYGTPDLISGVWTSISSQTDIPGSGGVDALTDPSPPNAPGFYRLGVRLR